MKFDILDFKNTMALGFDRCKVGAKRHLPEILFVGAVAFIFDGLYEAGKAGVKWELDYNYGHEKALDDIEEELNDGQITEKEAAIETAKEYGSVAIDWTKCWAKSLIVTTIGIGMAGAGFKILKDENRDLKNGLLDMALATAAYRGRVRDFVGEEKEFDLFHNIKRELVEEEYIDENGKKKKRKVEKIVNEDEQVRGGHNSYFFGVGDRHYNDMLSNKFFIEDSEKMFNRMLVGRGDHGVLKKAEVLRHFHWDDSDPYPFEAEDNGWIYLENERNNENAYEYYDDCYLNGRRIPRIVKFTTNKDFGVTTGETYVDMNCYPVMPYLKEYQERLLKERRDANIGKYIAATM